MAVRTLDSWRDLRRTALKLAVLVCAGAVFFSAVLAVALSPIAITALDRGDRDWSRLSDIGQTYGAVSALLSALALGVVATSLRLQRSQVRHERVWLQRELHLNVVKIALDDPVYAQCWGPRVAPPDIDERLFYYVNLIIMMWSYAWEHCQLQEDQVRSYTAALFESAVPREYWARFGGWCHPMRRCRERRFYQIVNDEYQKAVQAGPPTRPYEPPTGEFGAPAFTASPGWSSGQATYLRMRRINRHNMPDRYIMTVRRPR